MILEYQNIHSIHDLKISAVNHLSLSLRVQLFTYMRIHVRPTQQISKQNTPHITHPLLPLNLHTHTFHNVLLSAAFAMRKKTLSKLVCCNAHSFTNSLRFASITLNVSEIFTVPSFIL